MAPTDGTDAEKLEAKPDKPVAARDVNWPPPEELETWLMNSVKDTDRGALFLRRMLQMNPAYGQYLTADEDTAGIVQLFAKRLHRKILSTEGGWQPAYLYEMLCECAWRVIGHTLDTVCDLQDNDTLPVPKEACGQVKMLLQTNVVLSKKLNEIRREYLRELTRHRDQQRKLSKSAERALNALQEDPIMFYEPLSYVLDETTKAFVREVVEEKIKLEQRSRVVEEEVEVEHDMDSADLEQQLKNALAELRQLRASAARAEDTAKRLLDQEKKLKFEAEQATKKATDLQTKVDALEKDNQQLLQQIRQLKAKMGEMSDELGKEIPETVVMEDPRIGELEEELQRRLAEMEAMQKQVAQLEQDKKQHENELKKAKEQISNLEAAGETKQAPPVIVSDDTQLKDALEKSLQVEKELRAANRALEKALAEEKDKAKKVKPVKGAESVTVSKQGASEDEIAEAIKAVTEQHEKKIKEQEREIAKLKAEVERLKGELGEAQDGAGKKKKPKPEAVEDDGEADKAMKWKGKYLELEEKHEDLQHEYEKLEQQLRLLLDKLKQLGGQDVVNEVLLKIKLTAPPPKKQRKKKAYERLYDDAQRRIIDMRMKAEKMRKLEEASLMDATKRIKDSRNVRQTEMLNHLQKAAQATRARFQDALAGYVDETEGPDSSGAEGGEIDGMGSSGDGYYSPSSRGRTMERSGGHSPMGRGVYNIAEDPQQLVEQIEQLKHECRALQQEVVRLGGASGDPASALQSRQISAQMGKTSSTGALGATWGAYSALSLTGPRGGSSSPSPKQREAPMPEMSSKPVFGQLARSKTGSGLGGSQSAARGGVSLPAQRASVVAHERSGPRVPSPPVAPRFPGAAQREASQGSSSPERSVSAGLGDSGERFRSGTGGSDRGKSPAEPRALLEKPQVQGRPFNRPALTTVGSQGSLGSTIKDSLGQTGMNRSPQGQSAASLFTASAPAPPWRHPATPSDLSVLAAAAGQGQANPPTPEQSVSRAPPGQAFRDIGPEWAPGVPGRVPTPTNALEPITPSGRSAGSRSPPPRTPEEVGLGHSGRRAVSSPRSLVTQSRTSGGVARPGEPLQPLPRAQSTTTFDVAARGSRNGKGKLQKTPVIPDYGINPQPTTFCVTALRSQQSLSAAERGHM